MKEEVNNIYTANGYNYMLETVLMMILYSILYNSIILETALNHCLGSDNALLHPSLTSVDDVENKAQQDTLLKKSNQCLHWLKMDYIPITAHLAMFYSSKTPAFLPVIADFYYMSCYLTVYKFKSIWSFCHTGPCQ